MESQFIEAFGPHLILGGNGCRQECLTDQNLVHRFLIKMPILVKMTPISPVVVMETVNGISGFVIIAESHIVVHTHIKDRQVHVDIFSCKDFDTGLATTLFCEFFGPFDKTEYQLLDRGLEFPRNKEIVAEFVRKDRSNYHPT